jgi:hypothetical protein
MQDNRLLETEAEIRQLRETVHSMRAELERRLHDKSRTRSPNPPKRSSSFG